VLFIASSSLNLKLLRGFIMDITAPSSDERKDKKKFSASLRRNISLVHEYKRLKKVSLKFTECSSPPQDRMQTASMCGNMVGSSHSMRNIHSLIKRIGKTTTSVLITGESGTGKELVARAVHSAGAGGDTGGSASAKEPFVAINCGAIPSTLIESELFGHERGAFTGALKRKIGKLELARGGTLFLDEVASLPLSSQVKLLRFLQERTFTRVGGNDIVKVDLRVIAAANVNLREAVQRGEFRGDLFYRLNVVPIEVPPLRERKDDIVLLAGHFLKKYSTKYSRNISGIQSETLCALKAYNWPGNVRELENIMERIVVLAVDEGPVKKSALPEEIFSTPLKNFSGGSDRPAESFKDAVRAFERSYITTLLDKTGWNKTKTAQLMQVHRNTLLMKIKLLEISHQ